MAAEVKLEREECLMIKLPPVPKRKTYQDIGENDLVAALFYDRIADELDPDKREQRDEQEAATKRAELERELDTL
jgi:hypothetical protein